MTDPRDDALRHALEAEAAGVEAGTDLLARVRSAAAVPVPVATRRRLPLVLAAAAIIGLAAIAVGVVVAGRDDPASLEVVDDPDGTPSPTTPSPTEPSTTTTPSDPGTDGSEPPRLVAFVRFDGWLVVRDLATGTERELRTEGDPRVEQEGGAYSIDSVELSPDGRWVYYSTCCEPAAGTTYRVPVDGGEPQLVGYGYEPAVSPDGRFVALTGGDRIWIRSTDALGYDEDVVATLEGLDLVRSLAWSPDSTRLAFVEGGVPGEPGTLRTRAWDGSTLTDDPVGSGAPEASFVGWDAQGMPVAVSGAPVDDDRSHAVDATHQWVLLVDEAGRVGYHRLAGGEGEGVLDDLPEVIAADW